MSTTSIRILCLLFLSGVGLMTGLTPLYGQPVFSPSGYFDHIPFHQCDTLRGALNPERSCFDVTFYHLDLRIDPATRQVGGSVDIHFLAVADFERIQVDLFRNLTIDSITSPDRGLLKWVRECDAVLIEAGTHAAGQEGIIRVAYHGTPVTAPMPPWDGGFVWATDKDGMPWVAVACEGEGASLWWPNKDHLSDEPDSLSMRIEVPATLSCIANGNLRKVEPTEPGWHAFHWAVSYPINNYNVSVNIGRYAHFSDIWVASDGDSLQCDYYVMHHNLEKAMEHFQQVHPMLDCFESIFGKYPFWNDGFALVETPYLGMEHQSAIAYGNKYQRGYLGGMIPEDMDWDYIIIHETGHEYWGNSIGCNDLSEMWIHESFTTYMEALYVECRYGYQDAIRYLNSQRNYIRNLEPIIGPNGVNWHNWKSSDHYYKGAWVLHTLRHATGDEGLWYPLLRQLYERHAMQQITTEEIVDFVNTATGKDWTAFFRQYLLHPAIPQLEYSVKATARGTMLTCRWVADEPGFAMPVVVGSPKKKVQITPGTEIRSFELEGIAPAEFQVATDLFLVSTKEIKP